MNFGARKPLVSRCLGNGFVQSGQQARIFLVALIEVSGAIILQEGTPRFDGEMTKFVGRQVLQFGFDFNKAHGNIVRQKLKF